MSKSMSDDESGKESESDMEYYEDPDNQSDDTSLEYSEDEDILEDEDIPVETRGIILPSPIERITQTERSIPGDIRQSSGRQTKKYSQPSRTRTKKYTQYEERQTPGRFIPHPEERQTKEYIQQSSRLPPRMTYKKKMGNLSVSKIPETRKSRIEKPDPLDIIKKSVAPRRQTFLTFEDKSGFPEGRILDIISDNQQLSNAEDPILEYLTTYITSVIIQHRNMRADRAKYLGELIANMTIYGGRYDLENNALIRIVDKISQRVGGI